MHPLAPVCRQRVSLYTEYARNEANAIFLKIIINNAVFYDYAVFSTVPEVFSTRTVHLHQSVQRRELSISISKFIAKKKVDIVEFQAYLVDYLIEELFFSIFDKYHL
jgi:hypothetical protein